MIKLTKVARWSDRSSVIIPDLVTAAQLLTNMWSMSVAEWLVTRVGNAIVGVNPCSDKQLTNFVLGS